MQNEIISIGVCWFSYDKLWKKINRRKIIINPTKIYKYNPSYHSEMKRDENVNMEIIGRICRYFKYGISYILEYRILDN